MRKIFVLDTNILIETAGSAITGFEDNIVVITSTVLEELNNHKGDPGERGYQVRETSRIIEKFISKSIAEKSDLTKGLNLPNGGMLVFEPNGLSHELPLGWDRSVADNRILSTVLTLKDKNKGKEVILVTNDTLFYSKAAIVGIHVQNYKNDQVNTDEQYLGKTEIKTTVANINKLYSDKVIKIPARVKMFENEYAIVTAGSASALAQAKGSDLHLIDQNVCIPGIKPLNVSQRFAIHALLAPATEIPLVIVKGPAGCGKTLLAIAAGLDQTNTGDEFVRNKKDKTASYERVIISRSQSIPQGEDLGALPGTLEEKMDPLLAPFFDNLESVIKIKNGEGNVSLEDIEQEKEDLISSGIIKIVSMGFIRGRSISNSYIIIDEAQNLTPTQAKTIVTRAGKGTKIVLLGDPDQIDNPRLSKRSNGLVYVAEKMKNSKSCTQITFSEDECIRSELSREASKLL